MFVDDLGEGGGEVGGLGRRMRGLGWGEVMGFVSLNGRERVEGMGGQEMRSSLGGDATG